VLDASQQPAGYVLAREVYTQLLEGILDLPQILRKIPAFPETAAAVTVLRSLQEAHSEIGLLVEETGSPSGLVSIETLAEELFGEIAAEHEITRPSLVHQADGSIIVRGDTPLHELNRDLGLELPIAATSSTLGGLVLAAWGRFPAAGDKVALPGGIDAEVEETSARRVLLVRLRHR
jgi:putative hemolysin